MPPSLSTKLKREGTMNIATKTLATIMLITMLTMSTVHVSAEAPSQNNKQREGRQLERMYKHHDRKMELRASVLGISSDELKAKLKEQSFDQVIKQSGFKTRESFHTALLGKMKEELRARGWDEQRVSDFMQKRLQRYAKATTNN